MTTAIYPGIYESHEQAKRKKDSEKYSRDLLSDQFSFLSRRSLGPTAYKYWCRFRFGTPYANGYPSSGDTPYNVSSNDDDGETDEVCTQEDTETCHCMPGRVMLW